MSDQKSKWHETRKARMEDLFEGRKYRVVEEVNLDEPVATPLGYKVKKGYKVELITAPISNDEPTSFVVGKALLKQMSNDYDAVENMPENKKRGRPRKQPLEQAEVWANREMPSDASPVTQAGPTMINPNEDEHFEG